jgi:hypothetical protein
MEKYIWINLINFILLEITEDYKDNEKSLKANELTPFEFMNKTKNTSNG